MTFHNARAQTLPLDDEFELTITWAVLTHIPSADIDRTAAEIRRVTDPDGATIVSEQVHEIQPSRCRSCARCRRIDGFSNHGSWWTSTIVRWRNRTGTTITSRACGGSSETRGTSAMG